MRVRAVGAVFHSAAGSANARFFKFAIVKMRTVLLLGLTLLALTPARQIWRESSFADFSDGTFGDGGANMYVSAKGRIQTINRWDVNGDGYIDILFANSHPLVEMLDISIYWGNGKDFSIRRHSYIPADGPQWVTPADLNGDGEMDLVVANYSNGTWTGMDSFIYYGGLKDPDYRAGPGEWAFYPFRERISLPTNAAQKAAVGDLNRDGYPDIVFAFSAGYWEYRSSGAGAPSRIYWGSAEGFSATQFTEIAGSDARDVAVADLNGDGQPEIVLANGSGQASFIYWGSDAGFEPARRAELPTLEANAVKVADLNQDGWPDLVFANQQGTVSWAYLNEKGSFHSSRRVEFETYTAKDCVVEDFNRDGWADVFFTNHMYSFSGDQRAGNRLIDSYLYFGSPEGFSKENRQNLQTIGAWGASAADLNSDGWTDLVISNFQEHYSFEVPSFIYWNGPKGFSLTMRTPLYEHGAQGNAIADLNGDGFPDILITSMMGRSRADYDPNYLYFGNSKGLYSPEERIELPGREAYEQAMADLDDDGQVDIVLANRGETGRLANEAWIYWNENSAFDPWRITGLPTYAASAVEVNDLDRDGYLDIVTCNHTSPPGTEGIDPGVLIYWGSADGWITTQRSSLNINATRAPAIADINRDGHLDLVFGQEGGDDGVASIFWGDGTREYSDLRRYSIEGAVATGTPDVADLNKDGQLDIVFAGPQVRVYYGEAGGRFSIDRAQVLDIQAKTMTIADVNGDGWLDLVCPVYKIGGRRSLSSHVLLGSATGFEAARRIDLPTDSGTGSIVSDFNFDGYPDIFFFCHRRDGSPDEIRNYGDHLTDSFLYWGGPRGFRPENRHQFPGRGVHYDVGVDLGHIYNRGFLFDYISSPYQCGSRIATMINWAAETPSGTEIRFQLRRAQTRDELSSAVWTGPGGAETYYTRRNSPVSHLPEGDWIQYRAVFDTGNGASSPVLTAVEITLE